LAYNLNMKNTILDKLSTKIISLQNYNLVNHPAPYILKSKYKNQDIIEIGVEHSYNLKHKNYVQINSLFLEFIKTHLKNKIILLVENNFQIQNLSKRKAISKYGESGFILWLANKYNIQTICPEPSQREILIFASKKIKNKYNLLLWIFTNLLSSSLINKEIIDRQSIATIMRQVISAGKIVDINESEDKLLKYFGHTISKITKNKIAFLNKNELLECKLNISLLKDIQSPFLKKSVLNKIGAHINIARDTYILSKKINVLKKGFHIFSVYGRNHVVCQEQALKEFIKINKP